MKKKIILLLLITCLHSIISIAQSKKRGSEKIRTYKIAYLTETLNLTKNEALKFWPIYNKYDKKMIALHKKERFILKKRIPENGGIDNLSENDSKEILEKIKIIKEEQHLIKTSFNNKIYNILSYKKILALHIFEHKFNHKLVRKLRGKK
ncbi:hypothetical protein [Tenacibaculum aestuariivivum]|uniref:hypothetical protein n=1 Tax=Tenacibaculum aestuariivivum TaxID=2006131 RepID=UPI003AB6708B